MAARTTSEPEKTDPNHLLSVAAAAVATDCKADVLLYCGGLDFDGWKSVYTAVAERKKRAEHVCLYITTGGGSADSAYRIISFLKHSYPGKLTLVVDWYCKSAGTLLAIGADELVLSNIAELGPLDVQLRKTDELGERTSGLTPFQALRALKEFVFDDFEYFFSATRKMGLGYITTRTAAEVASGLVTGLYKRIYGQIDPMRLGEMSRSLLIANEYGERLGLDNLHDGALEKLVSGYPTHSFAIDRREAERLFRNVREPTQTEQNLMVLLHRLVEQHVDAEEAIVFYLNEESNHDQSSSASTSSAASEPGPPRTGIEASATADQGDSSRAQPSPPSVSNGEAATMRA
jgi:hypothetical protein